jgi:tRNA (guanine-N7-)-methyltransferase
VSRKKRERFLQNAASENVIEKGKSLYSTIKGKWREAYFKNDHPITLELACGRGEFSSTFAEHVAERNFIGVDIKGARLWKGSQVALEKGLKNVAFLRTSIQYMEEFFEPGEVDEIYIVFPDPQPRDYQEQYRLTNERFLTLYKKLIKQGGTFHLKTDNAFLYHYTVETVDKLGGEWVFKTEDFDESELKDAHFGVKTKYEELFKQKGETIHYLKFKLN